MQKNPFLDDAMNAKDELLQRHTSEIKKLTLQDVDLSKLLPKSEDQKSLQKLIGSLNQQTTDNARLQYLEENVKNYSGIVINVARTLLLKV